jgi:hypothetical protein
LGQLIVEFAGGVTQNITTDVGPSVITGWALVTDDPDGNWDVGLGEWTCPKSGIYEIQCRVHYAEQIGAVTALATRNINLQIDAVNRKSQDSVQPGGVPVSPALPDPMGLFWRGDLGQGDVVRVRTRADGDFAASVQEFGSVPAFTDAGTTWLSIVEDYRFIRP